MRARSPPMGNTWELYVPAHTTYGVLGTVSPTLTEGSAAKAGGLTTIQLCALIHTLKCKIEYTAFTRYWITARLSFRE